MDKDELILLLNRAGKVAVLEIEATGDFKLTNDSANNLSTCINVTRLTGRSQLIIRCCQEIDTGDEPAVAELYAEYLQKILDDLTNQLLESFSVTVRHSFANIFVANIWREQKKI